MKEIIVAATFLVIGLGALSSTIAYAVWGFSWWEQISAHDAGRAPTLGLLHVGFIVAGIVGFSYLMYVFSDD